MGYDPVLRDTPRDHETPVAISAQVLAGDRGQQLGGLAQRAAEDAAIERCEHRGGVRAERVHQRQTSLGVVPVTHRLAPQGVIAAQDHTPRGGIRGGQHRADGAVKHRDGVLGRHRVIDRHRVQHPPLRQRPRRAGRGQHRVKDPPRPRRSRQPGPHPHQHRVAEPTPVDIEDPARVPPAQIELERGHRLTIRQPEPALQPPSPTPPPAAARCDGPAS